jgi:AcrR family transcriptional regulator
MARTLDPQAFAIRRDAFLDAAQRLMQTKGYEAMSIQDVLDETHASKGAFYHYFGSKTDLLDAIVERLVEAGVAHVRHGIDDPARTALQKFESFFGDLAAYKLERRELILGFMRAWLSDDNAIVREHFRRGLVARLRPAMTTIVRQGVDEGVFHADAPEATARVLISLLQGLNEDATGLWLALDDGSIAFDDVGVRLQAYLQAFERILDAEPGALKFPDTSVLRDWHEWQQAHRKDRS